MPTTPRPRCCSSTDRSTTTGRSRKGRSKQGESDEECAVREVEEETGLVCSLGRELTSTGYVDAKGRPKEVRYWVMNVVGGELRFEHEVDDARWVTLDGAAGLLSYERDLEVLAELG